MRETRWLAMADTAMIATPRPGISIGLRTITLCTAWYTIQAAATRNQRRFDRA